MHDVRHIYLFLLIFLAAMVSGCPDDEGTRDAGLDTATDITNDFDTGSDSEDDPAIDPSVDRAPDSSSDLDAAVDAGAISVTVETTSQWQRGTVSLTYAVDAPSGASFTVAAGFTTRDPASGPFISATPLDDFGDGAGPVGPGHHRFVWNSFADVSADANDVWVQIEITDNRGSTASAPAGPFALLNDPDRRRVVLMTSSINENDQVRRLEWTNGSGLSYDDNVSTVSLSPDAAAFDAGGRTAAVVGGYDAKILFLTFEPDGDIREQLSFDTPDLRFESAEFSPDGTVLYLLVYNPTDYGGGIYRMAIDPWTALPAEGASPELLHAVFVPTSFALVPDQRGIVLHGTSRDDPRGAIRVQWIDLDGTLIDDVYHAPEDSSAELVGVSPNGRWALSSYSNLFTGVGGVQLVELGDSGDLSIAADNSALALGWAGDVAFHSDSTAAIVTQISPDRVFSLSINTNGTIAQIDSLVLGAADRIAHTGVGTDRNTFFVTTVHPRLSELGSGLGMVELSSDGSAIALDPFYLGSGLEKIPSDVAIQP